MTWCAQQPRPQFATLERVHVSSDWFQVYRVDPGVYAIAEPHQWEEVISYLILGKSRALLFDTGMGMDDIRRVVSEITALPVAVFNSHTHHDHVGGNWQFDRIYALNTSYTRANARGKDHAAVAPEVAAAHVCGHWPAGFDTAAYVSRPFRITDTVHDGSIIDLGNRQLRVLAIPGHAPDASALFDSAHGLLFTGDTFYEGPIYVFSPGADFSMFRHSADRLAALAPRTRKVLTAHNVAVSDPHLLVQLRDDVRRIADGSAHGTIADGIGTYDFGAFSVMVRQ